MVNYADLTAHQGDDTVFRLELIDADKTPKDLTGASARSQFKRNYAASDSDTYSFTTSIDSAASTLDLSLDGTTSDDIKAGRYFYDVFLLNGNTSEKILEGRIEILPSATSIV